MTVITAIKNKVITCSVRKTQLGVEVGGTMENSRLNLVASPNTQVVIRKAELTGRRLQRASAVKLPTQLIPM